jgi:chromosome segregation ATPase
VSPPFGFFKKKEAPAHQAKEQDLPSEIQDGGNLTLQQAQSLLKDVESEKVKALSARLLPTRQAVASSLKSIENIADELAADRIKFEDGEARFKSIAENSKRTVVATLKRESTSDLPESVQSISDARKFKERLEAIISRISEVSGSHKSVLNVFMKKYVGRLRQEFENLSSQLEQVRSLMSEFEQERAPLVKCGNLLNTASQKASSIKSGELAIQDAIADITNMQAELASQKQSLLSLEGTQEFKDAFTAWQQIDAAEEQENRLHIQMSELFGHLSRALSKYSYNVTKETARRLQILSEEPWKILEEQDMTPYTALLSEIRKEIDSNKLQLKDSEKTVNYIDSIISSLPSLQSTFAEIKSRKESLIAGSKRGLVVESNRLKQSIQHYETQLAARQQELEQLKRQNSERGADLQELLRQVEQLLQEITRKKYALTA